MSRQALCALHRDMPRQGPGSPADVHWALRHAGLTPRARVCDAGCGPGADLETFAQALPMAELHGVEMLKHLAAEARLRCARFSNVSLRTGDMAALDGPYDLIWCAGALYFLGITNGLCGWRAALAPGGMVAFSEPVLGAGASAAARAFWADYPDVSDMAGIAARVASAGFGVKAHRMIVGAPWADYYTALAGRVAALRPGADAELAGVLDAAEAEIAGWRAAPAEIGYVLVLARPVLRGTGDG